MGNPPPVFLSNILIIEKKTFGKKNEHLRLYVKDPKKNSFPIEFIFFGKAEEYESLQKNQTFPCVYTPQVNRWNWRESVQGRIKNILLNQIS
jgi:single-stranded DNA-specific DHH superfamily exonuclease